MHRRGAASILVIAVVLAACESGGSATPASTQSASVLPASAAPAIQGSPLPGRSLPDGTVRIATAEWVAFLTVTSCSSPGPNIANIQATGPDADGPDAILDLRAAGEGVFTISGRHRMEGLVDEILVADDGSVTASGTITVPDFPELSGPFTLIAMPGSCN
jgi:hypothetical protein